MIYVTPRRLRAVLAVLPLLAAAAVRAAAPDRQSPVIVVLPPAAVSVTHALNVRAHIEDESGVGVVTLWAKGESDTEYRPFAMELGEQGDFVGVLPVWPSRGLQVTYYVEAIDLRGNGPRRSGSPRMPFVAAFKAGVEEDEKTRAAANASGGWPKRVLLLAPILGLFLWWKLGPRPRKSGRPPAVAESPGLPSLPQASIDALWSGSSRGAAPG